MKTAANDDDVKERTALLSIILDLLQIVPTVVIAILANSMTLYSDLFGDLNVLIANLVIWLILYKVKKGKASHFDYGLGKIENLLGVVGAWFVVLCVGSIMYMSVQRLFDPIPLSTGPVLMGVVNMLIGVIIYGYLWMRNLKICKQLPSPVTELQWRVPMSNTLESGCILVTLLATVLFQSYAWSLYIDPVVSLLMGAYITYSFFGLIKASLLDLLDRTLEENDQLIIVRELVSFFNEYEHLHGVRSRRAGAKIFVEIFLEFDADRRMGEVQQVIDAIKESLEGKIENSSVSVSLTTRPERR